jgi:hypothetical protein
MINNVLIKGNQTSDTSGLVNGENVPAFLEGDGTSLDFGPGEHGRIIAGNRE